MNIQEIIKNTINLNCLDNVSQKEAQDLTEEERFALCYLSGVEIEIKSELNKIYFKTKNPCSITKINNKFKVFEKRI